MARGISKDSVTFRTIQLNIAKIDDEISKKREQRAKLVADLQKERSKPKRV